MNSIILGRGRTLFEGVGSKVALKLIKNRPFGNGNVIVYHAPLA